VRDKTYRNLWKEISNLTIKFNGVEENCFKFLKFYFWQVVTPSILNKAYIE